MKTVINNVTVLTMDKAENVYKNGYVVIEGTKIAGVGEGTGPQDADQTVDGQGGILMPGMINTHSHISMIPFRSLGEDGKDRLRKLFFPLEREALTPELVRQGARYAVCELLLGGVTSVMDMYYFEDAVAQACDEMGIDAWTGQTIIEMETCDSRNAADALKLNEELIKKWKGHGRIHPVVAPHATNTNGPETLQAAYELAQKYDVPYTLHVCEMDYEMTMFREKYDKTPVEFLYGIGVLGPRTVAAHCIHLSDHDIELFAESGAKIAHCAIANAKSGKGVCRAYDAKQAGVTVGVGTDGPSSGNTIDLLTQLRIIPPLQKTRRHDNTIFSAKETAFMGTIEGAKVLGAQNEIGSIETGKRANLTLIETQSVNMFPIYEPYAAVVYMANPSNVDSVWVDGKQLVKGHKLLFADHLEERAKLEALMPEFRRMSANYRDF